MNRIRRSPAQSWLNRTVFGIALASLFSDWSHEIATAVLPAFLALWGPFRARTPTWLLTPGAGFSVAQRELPIAEYSVSFGRCRVLHTGAGTLYLNPNSSRMKFLTPSGPVRWSHTAPFCRSQRTSNPKNGQHFRSNSTHATKCEVSIRLVSIWNA